MTEREKIIKIIADNRECFPDIDKCDKCRNKNETVGTANYCTTYKIADALIAAGIGDMSKQRLLVGKDGTVKQLYSGEEVEQIVKEREEYKHRAEVAERALKKLASFFAHNAKFLKDEREKERYQKTIFDDWINQAEEELAEERKDD